MRGEAAEESKEPEEEDDDDDVDKERLRGRRVVEIEGTKRGRCKGDRLMGDKEEEEAPSLSE